MGIVKTEGIVLRYADYKEADRVVTLLTPEMGKLTVSARGARKPKSRLLAGSQLFCHSDCFLFKLNDTYSMSQAEVIDSFFDIRKDIGRLSYATYVLNLAEESVVHDERSKYIYHLLLCALNLFAYSDLNDQDITHAFEIKLIDLLGYRPVLDRCSICENMLPGQTRVSFSVADGGLVCEKCKSKALTLLPASLSTVMTLSHLLGTDMRRLSILKTSSSMRQELELILPLYLEFILEKKMKARKLIDNTEMLKRNGTLSQNQIPKAESPS